MPEYLTPGVYVEETSFRSRSIEGVPTSTCGMAGATRYGPVPYQLDGLAMVPEPVLVTSYTEFERAFGDLDPLFGDVSTPNYLGLSARAFFANGGRRLYISRVFPRDENGNIAADNFAALGVPVAAPAPVVRWRARWPGASGGEITVQVALQRSKNLIVRDRLGRAQVSGAQPGWLVEVVPAINESQPPAAGDLRVLARAADGTWVYRGDAGDEPITDGRQASHLRISVTVSMGERTDVYTELELGPDHPRSVYNVLNAEDPADEFALVWLERVPGPDNQPPSAAAALAALLTLTQPTFLAGGGDGPGLTPGDVAGRVADPDDLRRPATGLNALGEIEDIAIVAVPDTVRFTDEDEQKTVVDSLIEHCSSLRYRIGIVDPPAQSSISQVRQFRSRFDTTYAALYYPWVEIVDPTRRPDPGSPPSKLLIPPSGYVAGIYARSDIERGVHKAPANEVVLGITRFETNVTFQRQAVLNPEGINALRFFEGRSNRVWGARTMSSDPEWKYVNVRRLFIYLERSIDRSTQWAVFEPNNERLWASIRQTIEDFLLVTWRSGALMGNRPEEAYFVRCDRTTMTQNDLDNGRLICLIGVAPTYPAEFVIFRIGQWTADANRA
ncbi:phage tail sheath family protein [Actinoplanes solisilvae]|uniref:phage tail sheath family protein n=1 Tax=Actinoplanes solisilvae TaxID=2486853 RepID=UPI000FD97C7B|nr:phage tail sheath subtilisin-like domain-containing protein [Actinoplanes solisilvae]